MTDLVHKENVYPVISDLYRHLMMVSGGGCLNSTSHSVNNDYV
jgi:hypothetical protein